VSVLGLSIEYGIGSGDAASVQTFAAGLERLGSELSDFGKWVFPRIGSLFEKTIDRQFQGRGVGPVSGAWATLSPKYEKWKSVHFAGQGILERTGRLRSALTSNGTNALREYNATTMVFGTVMVPYASFHQTGTRAMPARPEFDFDSGFETELTKAMQAGLIEAARGQNIEVTP